MTLMNSMAEKIEIFFLKLSFDTIPARLDDTLEQYIHALIDGRT